MTIRHLLAYGQSDQASFRDPAVAETYATMTVPGTIASYFQEATAAFVLTIGKPYLIDPRTPLFQGSIGSPRASHLTLGDWHGPAVRRALESGAANFTAGFYSEAVLGEVVPEVVSRQREYAWHAHTVVPKIDRYRRLLARARGEDEDVTSAAAVPASGPERILAPYFAVDDADGPWWAVMSRIWGHCRALPNPEALTPVLCVGPRPGDPLLNAISLLDTCLARRPTHMSDDVFFWITGLQERSADAAVLRRLWQLVSEHASAGLSLTNMYGGFFSICLGHAGLAAFNNGLAYSEARDWPTLDATGAAPARYYIRQMHVFSPPATADRLVSRQSAFLCDCPVCQHVRVSGRSVVSMDYAELKAHFALARAWEIRLASESTPAEIAHHLRAARADYAITALPTGVRVESAHLSTWADVLDSF